LLLGALFTVRLENALPHGWMRETTHGGNVIGSYGPVGATRFVTFHKLHSEHFFKRPVFTGPQMCLISSLRHIASQYLRARFVNQLRRIGIN
jgi:hypothetical protein